LLPSSTNQIRLRGDLARGGEAHEQADHLLRVSSGTSYSLK